MYLKNILKRFFDYKANCSGTFPGSDDVSTRNDDVSVADVCVLQYSESRTCP